MFKGDYSCGKEEDWQRKITTQIITKTGRQYSDQLCFKPPTMDFTYIASKEDKKEVTLLALLYE